MSTRFIVSAVVAAVATYYGGPQAGATAFSLTYGVTGSLDPATKVTGPRLEDLTNVKASYGDPMTWVAGHPRVAGNIIWMSPKREVATTSEDDGKGGPGVETTVFTYEQDMLIVLCENLNYRPRRIWSNGKLVWSVANTADDETRFSSESTDSFREIRSYSGDASQLPDPTYEAAIGAGFTPSNRGRSTVMLVGVNLGGSGYPPKFEFEIVNDTGVAGESFIENFEDGLDEYAILQVDPYVGGFELEPTTPYGAAIRILGGNDPVVNSGPAHVLNQIERSSIPDTPFVRARWWFQVDDPTKDNDSPSILANGGGGPLFEFCGQREWYDDPLGRASLQLVGEGRVPVSDAVLNSGEWYRGELLILSTTECTFRLYTSDGNVISETSLTGTYPATWVVSELRFQDSGIGDGRTRNDFVLAAAGYSQYSKSSGIFANVIFDAGPIVLDLDATALDQVVIEQFVRAGLTEDDVDVTALVGQFVRAYGVGQVAAPRATLDALAEAYLFEYADDGTKHICVPRGGASVATISVENLGASANEQAAEPLPITRGNDIEVAALVVINYANASNDYQAGSERSDRLATNSSIVAVVQAPFGLLPTEAARLAACKIQDIASALMRVGPVAMDRRYAALLPTDVVTVVDEFEREHRIRLVKRTDAGGVLTFEAVFDDAEAVNSSAETNTGYTSSETVRRPTPAELEMLDIPMLREADNYLGQYAAISWQRGAGAALLESSDGNYEDRGAVTRRATVGDAIGALGDWNGGNVFDEVNSIEVRLSRGELASYTRDEVLAGTAPGYVIGSELLFARTAELIDDNVYRLSGLLRGRRGTEWATTAHATSERVVLLDNNGMLKVRHTVADLDESHNFKAVTSSLKLSQASAVPSTDTGVALKPFSPINVRVSRESGGLLITWDRRTRLAENWLLGTVPLGEDSEAYEVEISSGTSDPILRTLSGLGTTSAVYTSADQSADGVDDTTDLLITVYQMSATVGRGYGGSVETTGGYVTVAAQVEIEVGGTFAADRLLYAFVNGAQAQYLTEAGDINLDGAAAGLAIVIDALPGYNGSATGPTITIDAIGGGPVTVSAGVLEPSLVTPPTTTQIASGISAGLPEVWKVNLAVVGGLMPPGTYRLTFHNPAVGEFYAQYSTTSQFSPSTILAGLCADAAAGPAGTTYGITATSYGTYARVEFPTGEAGWSASGSTVTTTTFADVRWSSEQVQAAYPVVVAPQPQISYVGVNGAPAAGDTYHITINATTYDHTAGGSDTAADVAADLAAIVDADADVIAVDVSGTTPPGVPGAGGLIRITGVADTVPFTISTSTDATITLTVNVIIPGA